MTADEFLAALQALPCPHCDEIDALDMPDSGVTQELREFRELAGHWGSCPFRLEREREAAAVEAMLDADGCGAHGYDGPDWMVYRGCDACEKLARAAYLAARRGT